MATEEDLSGLIDDPDFAALDQRFGRFNLFEAIGAVRSEIKHSNLLAFLLSPTRSHGLGSGPLRLVLRAALSKVSAFDRPVRVLEVAIGKLDGALVYRESDHIDILIEISELHLVVAIENKVDAAEGENQLSRYRELVTRRYPGWRHLFVYLTPEGSEPSDANWVSISYAEVADIIENAASGLQASDIGLTVRHYVDMLRRHIVQDELVELAQRIYQRHREALDFIIDSIPEPGNPLSAVRRALDEQADLVQDRHTRTLLRFVPQQWEGIPLLNACPRGAWTKSGRSLIFEARYHKPAPEEERVVVALVLGECPPELRQHIYSQSREQGDLFKGANTSLGKQWCSIYSRELLSRNKSRLLGESERLEAVRKSWFEFVERDLPRLTLSVIEIVSSIPEGIR